MEIMQTKATLRSLRIAPRKVRLLIDLIRGMKVDAAIKQLQFSKKSAARPLLKLLKSAMANAKHNHGIKEDTLVIKTTYVDGGATLHRWIPRAMGRATPIRKRTSHITVVLEGMAEEKKNKKKVEGKEEEKKIEEVEKNKVEDKKKKEIKNTKKENGKKKEIKKVKK